MRHGVERARERREFGGPAAPRGADLQIAVADMHRHAGKRAQRPHDRVLAAEPDAEQHERADQGELEVGHAHLAIDAAQHLGLVEADRQKRIGVRQPREAEDAAHAVDPRDRRDAVARGSAARVSSGLASKRLRSHLSRPGCAASTVPASSTTSIMAPGRRAISAAMRSIHCSSKPAVMTPATRAVLVQRRHRGDEADTAARAADRLLADDESLGCAALPGNTAGPTGRTRCCSARSSRSTRPFAPTIDSPVIHGASDVAPARNRVQFSADSPSVACARATTCTTDLIAIDDFLLRLHDPGA